MSGIRTKGLGIRTLNQKERRIPNPFILPNNIIARGRPFKTDAEFTQNEKMYLRMRELKHINQ